jgi:hypothetical protein
LIKSSTEIVGGCIGTGLAIKGIIAAVVAGATDGLAAPAALAAIGASSCTTGSIHLYNVLPNGPKYITGVRMVK